MCLPWESEKILPQGKALEAKGLTLIRSRAGGGRDGWRAPHLVFSVIS